MDWKEFLRPTKTKLLVAAILFVLFVPVVNMFGSECTGEMCQDVGISINKASIIQILLPSLGNPAFRVDYLEVLYLNVLFGTIICYLLTCLLIFLYSKLSKRKK